MRPGAGTSLLGLLALALVACGSAADAPSAPAPSAVPDSAEATQPLAVGARLPEATLQDLEGRPVSLTRLSREGAVALVFYRGGW